MCVCCPGGGPEAWWSGRDRASWASHGCCRKGEEWVLARPRHWSRWWDVGGHSRGPAGPRRGGRRKQRAVRLAAWCSMWQLVSYSRHTTMRLQQMHLRQASSGPQHSQLSSPTTQHTPGSHRSSPCRLHGRVSSTARSGLDSHGRGGAAGALARTAHSTWQVAKVAAGGGRGWVGKAA